MSAMSFTESIRKVLSSYATFDGRAVRSEFWWFALFYVLVQLAGGVLDVTLFPESPFGPIGMLLTLALLLPYLAVSARRLHDVDRTGWWLLISFVPVIGAIVLVVFCVQRGTPGPNRFGAPPASKSADGTLAL